jgi:hypothetical protein
MSADQLGEHQPALRKIAPATHRERTGSAWFAGDIDRNRKAGGDSVAAAAAQDSLLPRPQADQRVELRPGKAGVDARACKMDRVVRCKAVADELARPAGGIIIEPNEMPPSVPYAHVVEQREIVEAEIARSPVDQLLELVERSAATGGSVEVVDPPRHGLEGPFPQAC